MSRGSRMLLAILLSARAGAEPAVGVASIWYRSSDACPDGAAFLQRLGQLGRSARLAGAGDTIDFVVTLGANHDGGSFGRLERQTERGTVAMREVEAAACEEVADALALSLDLALDPPQAAGEPPSLPAAPDAAAAGPETAGVSEPPSSPAVVPGTSPEPRRATPSSSSPTAQSPVRPSSGAAVRVGAQAILVTGVAEAPLLGAATFGELTFDRVTPRLTVLGATNSSDVDSYSLRMRLFAARLEGCVLPLGSSHLYFHTCAGVDLGVVDARYRSPSGGNDAAAWVSPTLLGRGVWSVVEPLTIEAQFGMHIPLLRYDVGEPGEVPLASTDRVGVGGGFGVGLTL